MVSTAYLGNGMFCISRPVSVPEQTPNGPVEITRFADREAPAWQAREIELPRQSRQCLEVHFIRRKALFSYSKYEE
jgi:hypothetical protein